MMSALHARNWRRYNGRAPREWCLVVRGECPRSRAERGAGSFYGRRWLIFFCHSHHFQKELLHLKKRRSAWWNRAPPIIPSSFLHQHPAKFIGIAITEFPAHSGGNVRRMRITANRDRFRPDAE